MLNGPISQDQRDQGWSVAAHSMPHYVEGEEEDIELGGAAFEDFQLESESEEQI